MNLSTMAWWFKGLMLAVMVALLWLCLTRVKADVNPGYDQAVISTMADEEDAQSPQAPIEGEISDREGDAPMVASRQDAGPAETDCPSEAIRKETWRVYVDLCEEKIRERNPDLGYEERRYLARAFVAGARALSLPLWVPMVLGEVESNFYQEAIGRAGERSVMQVLPWKGRPMKEIAADPRYAVRWALENCFLPEGRESISKGLRKYNRSRAYYRKVMRVRAERYSEAIWREVPR